MAKCKSCGADIIWIKMQSGKNMPCDAQPVVYWKNPKGKATIITPNGETYRADLTGDINKATGIGYIPHWATCPTAGTHRKQEANNGRE